MRGHFGLRLCLAGLCALTVMGCQRPLTPNERAFAADIFGDSLDTQKVRVAQGFGTLPPANATRAPRLLPVASPPHVGFCDRTAPQAPSGPPPAWALYNRLHFVTDIYRPDMAVAWPEAALFPEALIMAHELVHVWQWQHRARTGYRPARAALESLTNLDPYFYSPEDGSVFFSFGYEQQAALVEDYLCYALYDPANPRRADLRDILVPFFPLDRLDAALGQ